MITTCTLVPAGSHRGEPSSTTSSRAKEAECQRPRRCRLGSRLFVVPARTTTTTRSTKPASNRPSSSSPISGASAPSPARPCSRRPALLHAPARRAPGPALPAPERPPRHLPGRPTRRSSTNGPGGACPPRRTRQRRRHPVACPFCAGLLRSRQFPETMRRSRRAPLAVVAARRHRRAAARGSCRPRRPSCRSPSASPSGPPPGGSPMDRRQVVESVNAALKGGFADLSRGFFRVFGRTKITVLLGFTLAAYNLDRVRSFRAKLSRGAGANPSRRAKRRLGRGYCFASTESRVADRGTPDRRLNLSRSSEPRSPQRGDSGAPRQLRRKRARVTQTAGPQAGGLYVSGMAERVTDPSPPPTKGFMNMTGAIS